MKQQPKKAFGIFVFLMGMVFFLTACGKPAPDEAQIKEDLPKEARVIYIDSGYGSEEIVLDVTEINILKRQTNDKDDTVYCTIVMANDDYRYSANWVLTYNYYDQGGWILDDWYTEEETNPAEIIPLTGVPETTADSMMSNSYAEYSLNERCWGEDSEYGDKTTMFIYNVKSEALYCTMNGSVYLSYDFSNDGNYGEWYSTMQEADCSYDWNIDGIWKGNINSYHTYETTLELSALDLENGTIDVNGSASYFSGLTMETYTDESNGTETVACSASYETPGNPVLEFSINIVVPYKVTIYKDYAEVSRQIYSSSLEKES